jgi:hypothetical protein
MTLRCVCVAVVAGLLTSGCASARLAAPTLTPAQCVTDHRVVGTWTDRRATALGPVWMKFSMRADCSFSARVQMLFFRFTERGEYRAADGKIVFEREGGRTIWPYELVGAALRLTEAPGEVYAYRRR